MKKFPLFPSDEEVIAAIKSVPKHFANTTGDDRLMELPWTEEPRIELPAAVPSGNLVFYSGQAIGRDASGNAVQMDDSAAAEFLGIFTSLPRLNTDTGTAVTTNGLVGDAMLKVDRPYGFKAKIAAAAGGDEGKKVFWKYNNEVSYNTGTFGNFAGKVIQVISATRVLVQGPWLDSYNHSPYRATRLLAATGSLTLTKFDANKILLFRGTPSDQNIALPDVLTLSPGDQITVINTIGTQKAVFVPSGTQLINGANSNLNGTATQWLKNSLTVVDVSGTLQWVGALT